MKRTIRLCDCAEQCATKPYKWRLWTMRYGGSSILFEFQTWDAAIAYATRPTHKGWAVDG